jgi:hypothetical protein
LTLTAPGERLSPFTGGDTVCHVVALAADEVDQLWRHCLDAADGNGKSSHLAGLRSMNQSRMMIILKHGTLPLSPDANHLEAAVCKVVLHARQVLKHLAAGAAPACVTALVSIGSLLDLANFWQVAS